MGADKKILLFADWYAPGYKAGGPIRSCVNFVDNMRKDYRLFVFTSDRDLGALSPYPGIPVDVWQPGGAGGDDENTQVYYASLPKQSWSNIREQWEAIQPDFIYLNSMFSTRFTIYPLLIAKMARLRAKIILAPRGMLRESALRFKPIKKKMFLSVFRSLGFHRRLRFHASDKTEAGDIARIFGSKTKLTLIPNFPGKIAAPGEALEKKKGVLSMIFVGRIHPIKNLDFLLKVLGDMDAGPGLADAGSSGGHGSADSGSPLIHLTIAGSCEDQMFWNKCKALIDQLPKTIHVNYIGEIPNTQVSTLIAEHHIFVLPTRGENFGHAIFEALALGKPVLISDQTPWRNLESAGAGWDLPLARPDLFGQAIEEAIAWDQEDYADHCCRTRKYLEGGVSPSELKSEYLKLFS